jgi:predicted DNA repair protein MutK
MSSSLLALIDDIATLLDDVSVLSKVAAQKTAGVLGDDLALNAQQVTGLSAERELPVVWAVFKGSLVNKVILVPAALAISGVAPSLVTPLLMVGGAYLCFEGAEKLAHKFLPHGDEGHAHEAALLQALKDPAANLLSLEKDKIKGAIRTDFILSAEIIAITLGTVQSSPLLTQFLVLVGIAALMTFGVYGLVAGIVKIDDMGLYLIRRPSAVTQGGPLQALGRGLLRVTPWMMRTLSVVGMAAMFLVGGGILVHGVPFLHHLTNSLPMPFVWDALIGVVVGVIVLGVVLLVRKLRFRLACRARASK